MLLYVYELQHVSCCNVQKVRWAPVSGCAIARKERCDPRLKREQSFCVSKLPALEGAKHGCSSTELQ